MSKLEHLSKEQIDSFPRYVDKWIARGMSTAPADRPRAEQAIRGAYKAAGIEPPKYIIWVDSPYGLYFGKPIFDRVAQALSRADTWDIVQATAPSLAVAYFVSQFSRAVIRASIAKLFDGAGAARGADEALVETLSNAINQLIPGVAPVARPHAQPADSQARKPLDGIIKSIFEQIITQSGPYALDQDSVAKMMKRVRSRIGHDYQGYRLWMYSSRYDLERKIGLSRNVADTIHAGVDHVIQARGVTHRALSVVQTQIATQMMRRRRSKEMLRRTMPPLINGEILRLTGVDRELLGDDFWLKDHANLDRLNAYTNDLELHSEQIVSFLSEALEQDVARVLQAHVSKSRGESPAHVVDLLEAILQTRTRVKTDNRAIVALDRDEDVARLGGSMSTLAVARSSIVRVLTDVIYHQILHTMTLTSKDTSSALQEIKDSNLEAWEEIKESGMSYRDILTTYSKTGGAVYSGMVNVENGLHHAVFADQTTPPLPQELTQPARDPWTQHVVDLIQAVSDAQAVMDANPSHNGRAWRAANKTQKEALTELGKSVMLHLLVDLLAALQAAREVTASAPAGSPPVELRNSVARPPSDLVDLPIYVDGLDIRLGIQNAISHNNLVLSTHEAFIQSLYEAVASEIDEKEWRVITNEARSNVGLEIYGQNESWLSFYDFLAENGMAKEVEPMQPLIDLADSAGWWIPYHGVAFVSDRYQEIHLDERGLMHNTAGPAVAFRDGWKMYASHGVRLDAWIIETPDKISVFNIDSQSNAEVRRVMIEKYGADNYLKDSGATLKHQDETGKLWERRFRDDEALVMVEVQNSTPEPDGTFKTYFLRVPPNMRTAREAVAWTFETTPDSYKPFREA